MYELIFNPHPDGSGVLAGEEKLGVAMTTNGNSALR